MKIGGSGGIQARGMAKPGFANAGAAAGVCGDVENDVVRMRGIASEQARGARNSRQRARGGQVIEAEVIPHAPGDVVGRARSVATDADSADDLMSLRAETQAAPKDVYATA